jgi:hypothetical protein
MRFKFAALLLLGTLATTNSIAVAAPKHATVVVAKDPAGDWSAHLNPALAPLGDTLGQDLVSAAITAHPDTLDFTIATTSLPDQTARAGVFVWDLRVDGQWWRLSSFTCDPTEYVSATPAAPASCVPDGDGLFFEVLECGTDRLVNISANCSFRAAIQAVVDTAKASITIPVGRDLLAVRKGTVITPMDAMQGGPIISGPLLPYGGSSTFPGDAMTWTKPFKVR